MIAKDLLDMYDDWNGKTVVNDQHLNKLWSGKTYDLVDSENKYLYKKVIAFGFYDGEFCLCVCV